MDTLYAYFHFCGANQGLSSASQDNHHVHGMPTYPTFFATTKRIFKTDFEPTDNMPPKLHDKYTRHQWLND